MTDHTEPQQGSSSTGEEWFYRLHDGKVVRAQEARAVERLGPYPTREAAQRALELARERTEAADRADREWDEDGRDPQR